MNTQVHIFENLDIYKLIVKFCFYLCFPLNFAFPKLRSWRLFSATAFLYEKVGVIFFKFQAFQQSRYSCQIVCLHLLFYFFILIDGYLWSPWFMLGLFSFYALYPYLKISVSLWVPTVHRLIFP